MPPVRVYSTRESGKPSTPARYLHKGEIGIVRHYRLRKGGELYALATKLNAFLDDLLHSAFTAVKLRADLYGSGSYGGHSILLYGWIVHRVSYSIGDDRASQSSKYIFPS